MRSRYINPGERVSGGCDSASAGPKTAVSQKFIIYSDYKGKKRCVTLVGDEHTFYEMIENQSEQKRYTSLAEAIRERYEKVSCDTKNEKKQRNRRTEKEKQQKKGEQNLYGTGFRITLSDYLCVLWNSSILRGFVKAAGRK